MTTKKHDCRDCQHGVEIQEEHILEKWKPWTHYCTYRKTMTRAVRCEDWEDRNAKE